MQQQQQQQQQKQQQQHSSAGGGGPGSQPPCLAGSSVAATKCLQILCHTVNLSCSRGISTSTEIPTGFAI
jgi:hypothetical protein